MIVKDRLKVLLTSPLNGIDFVEVDQSAPLDVVVHFVNAVPLAGTVTNAMIDGGDSVATVDLAPIQASDWQSDGEGRPLLVLHALNAPDFSNYRLSLVSTKLDREYAATTFSFKVFCPSDFDCAPLPHECPPEGPPPPIDYLAKDFKSFCRALSDFSALRYPNWQERSEADFAVMFMEALSALGDDLSYQQDRIAAEATLDTATELRSLARHARLVDYDPRPATVARTMLACQVASGVTALATGIEVSASDPSGGVIPFEIGTGLADPASAYSVNVDWNVITPYWWDDAERCLPRGSTEMWVAGINHNFQPGQAMLIDTAAETTADPPIRQIVHLIALTSDELPAETTDPLFGNAPVTRIRWSPSEALQQDHDLTRTTLCGNVLPATQGRRQSTSFVAGPAPTVPATTPRTLLRLAANSTPAVPLFDHRFALRAAPLAWLATDDPDAPPLPEIVLQQPQTPPLKWDFVSRLVNAGIDEKVFGIEPARYSKIAELSDGTAQLEYDGAGGDTIFFGNGDFGAVPREGDQFDVTWRVGAGALGNVAADSITVVDPSMSAMLLAVTNPLPAAGGADRETDEQIRRRAPQAFQARQFRAVRAEDYESEAERLAWVQQAGTAFRWTGSWFTVFTAVDPLGGEVLPLDRHTEVIQLLNRRRLAGYESYVPLPQYVSIDLDIEICAAADAFRGDVEREVIQVLAPPAGTGGFFFADHFTFGTPLERSQIEAAIQSVQGVAGVESIRYRRRTQSPDYLELPEVLPLANDEILRIDNDASRPERGSLSLTVCGGR